MCLCVTVFVPPKFSFQRKDGELAKSGLRVSGSAPPRAIDSWKDPSYSLLRSYPLGFTGYPDKEERLGHHLTDFRIVLSRFFLPVLCS